MKFTTGALGPHQSKRSILDPTAVKIDTSLGPLRLPHWVLMTVSEADWHPQTFQIYFRTIYPNGQTVRCFSNPHDCCTFMKHLFSKNTELAFKALLLSTGKYQPLISCCLYLSQHHFLEDSRPALV